jgi:nitroreductase
MSDVNPRQAEHTIERLFLDRWSPRAYTGEEIPEATLLSLFEAARWAPSSYNSQPWRFIYSRRGSASWPVFFDLLGEFNRSWAHQAAALVIVASKNTMEVGGKVVPSRTHSFDTGAAWANLALQASVAGWPAHGLAGFDYDKAKTALGIPDGYTVEAAITIGKRGDKSLLPEAVQQRESPTPRQPQSAFVFEGAFPQAG